jgi:quercetin dioxygenase-like cupin family protein
VRERGGRKVQQTQRRKRNDEQILIILEGSEEHMIDGETILMKAGDVCVHPPNVEHGGRTPTGFKGIDIFSPPREDYLELMRKSKK